jgi:hypothetical protein
MFLIYLFHEQFKYLNLSSFHWGFRNITVFKVVTLNFKKSNFCVL